VRCDDLQNTTVNENVASWYEQSGPSVPAVDKAPLVPTHVTPFDAPVSLSSDKNMTVLEAVELAGRQSYTI
jgi:hypothetical protein